MRLAHWFCCLGIFAAACGSSAKPTASDGGTTPGGETGADGTATADGVPTGGDGGATAGDTDPSGADGGGGGPCGVPFQVDGLFGGWQPGSTCSEYSGSPNVKGQLGSYWAARPGVGALQFMADWTWRSDGPLCPALFARLRFSSGGGKQHWQVKVFGDKHMEVTQNAGNYAGAHQAGYSLGPSPADAQPHPQFEWRLDGVPSGQVAMWLEGPDKAANLQTDPATVKGCSLPDKALLRESTVLLAQLAPGGGVTLAPAKGLLAVTVDKPQTLAGEALTIWGVGFGAGAGSVAASDGSGQTLSCSVLAWQDDAVRVQVPSGPAGEVKIVVTSAAGTVGNPLYVTVKAPPDPNFCQGKSPATICDDGLSCTKNDKCKAGKCVGQDTCVASSPCATATCSAGSDCVEALSAPGMPCAGGKCAGFCSAAGLCAVSDSGGPCDDNDVCTAEFCDAQGCAHLPAADGSPCDDGNACTLSDTCAGGGCAAGKPDACNDNDTCTVDGCDPEKGCQWATACDDGNPCSIDSCAAGKCQVQMLADNTGCDDQNACTKGDHCSGGICGGTAIPGCK